MKKPVALAKIQFSQSGVVQTLGAATGAYFGNAAGLLNRTWYPILGNDLGVRVELALPWDAGSPSISVGDVSLINGGDALNDRILDQMLDAQVSGMQVEVRRGYDDQTWDEMEILFLSRTDRVRFDGEQLVLPQRPFLDGLDQPLAQQVFDETTPNQRIVNRTVPLLLGRAFQIEPLIWDAPNQIYYTASNLAEVERVAEGGNTTLSWGPVEFGHQMTAGTLLQITVDAVGPPPDAQQETTVVDWPLDAWTGGLPDGITVIQSAPDSTVTEATGGGAADIVASGSVPASTAWLSLSSPALFFPWGTGTFPDWSASSGALADAFTLDDGIAWANVSTWREATISVQGFAPALPAGSTVTGAEMELVYEGTDSILTGARLTDDRGFSIADLQPGFGLTIPGTKTTSTSGGANTRSVLTFTDAQINAGFGFTISVGRSGAGAGTAKFHQVRAKLHYSTAIVDPRLESQTAVLTAGKRYRVEITVSSADIWARWGSVAATGDPITSVSDPFSTTSAQFSSAGEFQFEFTPDASGIFALEFFRVATAGTGTVESVRVVERDDGITTYSGLVPYMATQIGLDASVVDQESIDANDDATGRSELGWYITGNESMAEAMDLFASSLSSTWWPDRDGKLRSVLWRIDPTQPPDVTIGPERVERGATVQTDPAQGATERAVGARNWRPLRISETAGIAETFSEQDRANVIEEWRVRRRANFAALNPWKLPPVIFSILPATGTSAGGTAVTISGAGFNDMTTATIGGQPLADLVVVDETTITGTTPAGAVGAADVVVTRGGQSDTLAGGFEYI